MLNLFKRQLPKHKHIFISFGLYYKLYLTEYRNYFDEICIYEKRKCECGFYEDVLISKKQFLPSMHNSNHEEKAFIAELKSKGIEEEYEINIRTKTIKTLLN